ncbi:MAG: FAD-binding protein [Caldilineaceae bacterium SB0664_bin_27]|uniref:FAD-binding protein n=1 Tax=Caldilineaceae bacterium SB0664_bin_27 TaxID=2605260 RepID=A0A6B0YTX5_9CHLR|nr:FAD-binding protein [Caldilineaceae bacterium SB0664_bin_27]
MTQYNPPLSPATLTSASFSESSQETRDLVHELEQVVEGEVRFDGYSRMLYSTDASQYQIQPLGVVIPRSEDDVQAAVELAARHSVPLLPRGGGSSLAGQCVGPGLVIDMTKYMDRILAVDAEAGAVTAQAGVSIGILNRTLAPLGLMLGPDPASADRASIGGSIGNNATGSHSILYGMMADNLLETNVVLSDGSMTRFGPVSSAELETRGRGDSLESRIYREVPAIVRAHFEQILERWPSHWRRVSGYGLDRLMHALLQDEAASNGDGRSSESASLLRARLGFDKLYRSEYCDTSQIDRINLSQLIAGSEGTLATVTSATLKLVPKPEMTALAVVHFDRLVDACAAIPDILETSPSASELLDKHLMDLARAQPEWAKRLHFVVGDPEAVLLTEFYGAGEDELAAKLDGLERHLKARGWRSTVVKLLDPVRQKDVWDVRKAGLNILMGRRGDYKPVPGIEDVSVPQEKLAEYLQKILDFCGEQEDVPGIAVYAHASAGCLHVRPLLNLKNRTGIDTLRTVGEHACDLAVSFGGAMSGEHGDGLARSYLHPRLFGPELYGAMRQVKEAFDPDNRMNPGKIIDAPPSTENLRFGKEYDTIPLQTVFDWSSDFGFDGAVEMCNGAGVCRKLGAGTMCPSYIATKDEKDTTRGRANALRNAMAGRIPREELFSPQMYEVMDLCIGCKACKSECPSAVDMARIKAEYLVHYYDRNGLPLFNRLMGMLPTLNRLLFKYGRPLIPLVNWGLKAAPVKATLAGIGIDPRRNLPAYARQPLSDWFARRPATARPNASNGKSRGSVILFHDTWSEYNHPEIGQAAVHVLEAAGYDVRLAEGRACCGRPLITGGQADKVRGWVDRNVGLLAPFARQGLPIVGLEPSCILTLRDEYLELATDRESAQIVAEHALTFDEFIARETTALEENKEGSQEGTDTPGSGFSEIWRDEPGTVSLHGHCHQKALIGNEASVAALRAAGYAVQVIDSGCCGMAGDFGYGKGHFEVSRDIGEERLFPAVRELPAGSLLVASGTSCREQIEQFAGRAPLHMAQVLAKALK